jgi:hypothetical protein
MDKWKQRLVRELSKSDSKLNEEQAGSLVDAECFEILKEIKKVLQIYAIDRDECSFQLNEIISILGRHNIDVESDYKFQ